MTPHAFVLDRLQPILGEGRHGLVVNDNYLGR